MHDFLAKNYIFVYYFFQHFRKKVSYVEDSNASVYFKIKFKVLAQAVYRNVRSKYLFFFHSLGRCSRSL